MKKKATEIHGNTKELFIFAKNLRTHNKKTMENNEYLTVAEVAELLRMSQNAVRIQVSRKKFVAPAYKVAGRLLFRRSEVNAGIEGQKVGW